ncbi:MAG: glycosyltransferase involved in cell wall biosynthesis [Candidatus Azotimanducaceae bacterium]|jgi:glycosyltransferase involved in cell wall biosynthesis
MNKHVFIIGLVWPEPDSTAAGTRMLQLIHLLQKNDYKITFGCAASKTDKSFPLEQLNIQTIDIELNNSNFDTQVKDLNPSIVLYDRYLTEEQYGWRVDENCPEALKILDTIDLQFLRHARHQAQKENTSATLVHFQSDIAKREIASIYRCDVSLIISKYEYEFLTETFNIDSSLLHYLPFLQKSISIDSINSYTSYEGRNHFMTIGNFKHQPNLDAVIHLKNSIWPIIRKKLPKAEIHIYGAYATERVQQLHNPKEGFIIKGWAENLEETFTSYRVCLAPIQFGAGLKGKLLDAMIYGTPSVTTSIGAEGMKENHDWNGFIENDLEKFVDKAIELFENKKEWIQAQKNGVTIINQCFEVSLFENVFLEKIRFSHTELNSHRLHNFTGSMLKHHTLKSTKYLSKWIEEKNS